MPRDAPFLERSKRHLAIVKGRVTRSVSSSVDANRIVFMHMPKCGGTSYSEAMYATVPLNHRIGVIDAHSTRRAAAMKHFGKDDLSLCHEDTDTGHHVFRLREDLLVQHMAWDTMLIHGHVLWSDIAFKHFGGLYKFVTIMRDPIERTFSNFRMAARMGNSDSDLDAYFDGPLARRQATVFLRYLTGQNDIDDDAIPAAIQTAKERLHQFAIVGFLEERNQFLEAYKQAFGVRLALPKLNVAPNPGAKVPAHHLDRLAALCAPDIEIYHYARSCFCEAA